MPDFASMPTLLTPAEVAVIVRDDPKTVTRRAKAGRVPAIRTLGGHRRYHRDDIRDIYMGIGGGSSA
jgi:predicted site-specific integrase-resolvase